MSNSSNAPLPFEQLAKAIEARHSVYGFISGLRLDRVARGEAWSNLPYRVFSSVISQQAFSTAAS
jgi:hypothetical protein